MTGGRTYRINVVSEMTGVPAATLRAWERRYGFPKPQRTDSRYRVYTEDDVAMVRRMKELLQSGMAPSDSAMLLMNESATAVPAPVDQDPFDACAQRIVGAARRMASDLIEKELRFAMTLGDAVQIVERVLVPAMHQIGEEWHQGKLTIAHEHVASEVITLAARQLLRLMPTSQARFHGLLACFAEEQHVMPLYAVAFRFVEQGIRPELLGLRTPPEAIASGVSERAPDLVGLSVTVAPDPARAGEWVEHYVRAVGNTPLIVGGAAVDAVAEGFERAGARVVRGGGQGVRDALRETVIELSRRGRGPR